MDNINNNVLEVSGLCKDYGNRRVLKNISFSVGRGDTVGFLGPNGAGKSTVMNIVTGYLSATSGSVRVCGRDILEEPLAAKQRIGYLPEQPPLYNDMRVGEYLSFVYELKKCCGDRKERVRECMKLVRIEDAADKMIKTLSKGYRQRVGIAQALISDPEILILDEPTVGLDPSQIIEFRHLISDVRKTRTVILSTHILQEITAVCGRIIIINNGEIILSGAVDELADETGCKIAAVCSAQTGKEILKRAGAECISCSEEEKETVFYTAADRSVRINIFKEFAAADIPLTELTADFETIEDIYMKAVSGSLAGSGDAAQ